MRIRRILREEIYRQYNIDNVINRNLQEGLSRLMLNESRAGQKSMRDAINLAVENGMSEEEADKFVRITVRDMLPALKSNSGEKYVFGCTRLYFDRQLFNPNFNKELNSILRLIISKYKDKFNQNLNDLSMKELSEQFSQELEDIETEYMNNKKEYTNNGYDIVLIETFDDAQYYYDDCYPESTWCITHMDDMWERYTNNGMNTVYFCLKKGFSKMDVPEQETGNFKDEYGLSMISVIVDENGKLQYSTTRWNHTNGASGEYDLTPNEISDIVGVNFYQAFKPNSNFNETVKEKIGQVKQGMPINKVFDDVIQNKNGITAIAYDEKYNLINQNGDLLSKQWFDGISNFDKDGYARVYLDDYVNLIDKDGKLLSYYWFDELSLYEFSNRGYKTVGLNNKGNWLQPDGNLLTKKWFDEVYSFNDGYAMAKDNGHKYKVDTEGNITEL